MHEINEIDGTNGIDGINREDREFKELRELRERLSLNSLNSLNSLISDFNQHADFSQAINFSSEVPRFVTKSKLHWKGVYYAYISFQGNELGGEDWCLSREINLLSEGVRFGLSQK